jgi:hypothetical protein
MTAREALLLSIQHWENNLNLALEDKRISKDGHDCACCVEYFSNSLEEEHSCDGCPIKKYTKAVLCCNTPYHKVYLNSQYYGLESDEANKQAQIKAIKDEITFLYKVLENE